MTGSSGPGYRWMAMLLEALFARYEPAEAQNLLRDLAARQRAVNDLTPQLTAVGMPPDMLSSSEGQNLFVAVLALRLKFPLEEARQKVALNIAMREGRR